MTLIRHNGVFAAAILIASSSSWLTAQSEVPELTGTVAFTVGSRSGRVERLVVQIGDGGTGKYKAVLTGEPGLPTHAIYRPRDLRRFGNGGCRNTSGEFRNMLSEIASQGFLIVATGPAGNAVVMGSEERTNTTLGTQLLDGVTWAIAENGRQGSVFYQKLDVTKIGVAGQSCGAQQAIEVSTDARVTTTIAMSQGINMAAPGGRGRGPGRASAAPADARYAPFAPALVRAPADAAAEAAAAPGANRADVLAKLHAPILYITGGEKDSGHRSAAMNFEAINQVPIVHAWQEVGHYPATFEEIAEQRTPSGRPGVCDLLWCLAARPSRLFDISGAEWRSFCQSGGGVAEVAP